MKRTFGLLLVAVALVACSQGNVFSIEEGTCFDDEGEFNDEVSSVPIVDCDDPHDNEVYAIFEMTDTDFPGSEAAGAQADQMCLPAFESFVGLGYDVSILDFGWLVPTDESWDGGDREIVCFLYRVDLEKMTGTMEGSGV